MSHLAPHLAAALGLDANAALAHVADLDVHGADLDTGSVRATLVALATLVQTHLVDDPYFRAPLHPPLATAVRSELKPWGRDPGVFLVHTDNADVIVRGQDDQGLVRVSPQDVIVDARSGPYHLSLRHGDVCQVLSVSPSALRVWTATAVPASARVADVPRLDALFAGLDAPAWLHDTVTARLSAATLWDVSLAWGLTLRVAPVAPGTDVFALLDAPPADAAALGWIAAQPGGPEALAGRIVWEVDQLSAALPALAQSVVDAAPEARAAVLDWLHRRDDLAAAAVLCAEGPTRQRVQAALGGLDRTASVHQGMFAFLDPFDDPRLGAVSWNEPDAWWATVPLGLSTAS